MDKSDLEQKELEKKKKEIAYALSIDVDNILLCKNYQPKHNPDKRDVEILEFFTKVQASSFQYFLYKFDHLKFQLNRVYCNYVIPNEFL